MAGQAIDRPSFMVLYVLRNHKAYWRRANGGGGRGRSSLYLSLHCHHQNDPCIKMGSDESHFNVSLIVRDKITRLFCVWTQTTTFLKRKENGSKIEPRPFCLPT